MSDFNSLPTQYTKIVLYELLQRKNIANVKCVVLSDLEKGNNYAGDIRRIKIVSKNNEEVVMNIILKYSLQENILGSFSIHDLYVQESLMYKVILPALTKLQDEFNVPKNKQFQFAKCYHANADLLLLEDLSSEGFQMHDRFTCFDWQHLELILKNLGRYHALSFALKEHYPDKYNDFVEFINHIMRIENLPTPFKLLSKQVIEVIDESLKEKMETYCKNMSEIFFRITNPEFSAPYNVFCHGDYWNSNMMFKYEDGVLVDMKLVDWQISKYSSPIIDLVYMLYTGTDSKIRSIYGSKIYDAYYDGLSDHLKYFKCDVEKCYPRDIFDKHMKEVIQYGLIMGMLNISLALSEKGKEINVNDLSDGDDNTNRKKLHFGKANLERLNDLVLDFVNMHIL